MWKINRGATKPTDTENLYDASVSYIVDGATIITCTGRVDLTNEESRNAFKAMINSELVTFQTQETEIANLIAQQEAFLNS